MLDKCKIALRISHNEFDDEINGLIKACEEELQESGIIRDNDIHLYERAVITYVKRDFGWANDDYDKLNESYKNQKIFLMSKGVDNE